jgi:hypothetical protein
MTLATSSRTMRIRNMVVEVGVEPTPGGYRPPALPPVLHHGNWAGWLVLPQLPPSSGLGRLLLTYTLSLIATAGIEPPSLSVS